MLSIDSPPIEHPTCFRTSVLNWNSLSWFGTFYPDLELAILIWNTLFNRHDTFSYGVSFRRTVTTPIEHPTCFKICSDLEHPILIRNILSWFGTHYSDFEHPSWFPTFFLTGTTPFHKVFLFQKAFLFQKVFLLQNDFLF